MNDVCTLYDLLDKRFSSYCRVSGSVECNETWSDSGL